MSEPPDAPVDADSIIRRLGLAPHPEGGHFRETWRDPGRDPAPDGERQSARISVSRVLAGWVLVGCTVSPAFRFDGFELAGDGWEP